MVVDAGEDVGEVGSGIETVRLGRFDHGHRAGEGFAAGIGTGEEPASH